MTPVVDDIEIAFAIGSLARTNVERVEQALDTLRQAGPAILPRLRHQLTVAANEHQRFALIRLIGELGTAEDVPLLLEQLGNPHRPEQAPRHVVVRALMQIGPRAIAPIREALRTATRHQEICLLDLLERFGALTDEDLATHVALRLAATPDGPRRLAQMPVLQRIHAAHADCDALRTQLRRHADNGSAEAASTLTRLDDNAARRESPATSTRCDAEAALALVDRLDQLDATRVLAVIRAVLSYTPREATRLTPLLAHYPPRGVMSERADLTHAMRLVLEALAASDTLDEAARHTIVQVWQASTTHRFPFDSLFGGVLELATWARLVHEHGPLESRLAAVIDEILTHQVDVLSAYRTEVVHGGAHIIERSSNRVLIERIANALEARHDAFSPDDRATQHLIAAQLHELGRLATWYERQLPGGFPDEALTAQRRALMRAALALGHAELIAALPQPLQRAMKATPTRPPTALLDEALRQLERRNQS